MDKETILKSYATAKEIYGSFGVDTDLVLEKMNHLSISLHCWQTDDVGGFETPDATLSGGGIQATGNYPGKAKNIGQVRADLEKVLSLLPGKQRINLHAIYGDFGGELVDRDQIELKHFQSWIDWCKKLGIGMDFNASCFSHPRAADGFTLSSKNEEKIWIKASGISLATIDEKGFVSLSRTKLKGISKKKYSTDPLLRESEVKADLHEAIVSPKELWTSVETSLHDLISYRFVVHTHPTIVNAVMCSNLAETSCREMFDDKALFVTYTDPGYILF